VASSARLSIAEKALEEILSRLRDAEPDDEVSALSARAFDYDLEISAWRGEQPTEERRRELVGRILELAIEVMHLPRPATSGRWRRKE
jgi:hypothetical protein